MSDGDSGQLRRHQVRRNAHDHRRARSLRGSPSRVTRAASAGRVRAFFGLTRRSAPPVRPDVAPGPDARLLHHRHERVVRARPPRGPERVGGTAPPTPASTPRSATSSSSTARPATPRRSHSSSRSRRSSTPAPASPSPTRSNSSTAASTSTTTGRRPRADRRAVSRAARAPGRRSIWRSRRGPRTPRSPSSSAVTDVATLPARPRHRRQARPQGLDLARHLRQGRPEGPRPRPGQGLGLQRLLPRSPGRAPRGTSRTRAATGRARRQYAAS